MAKQPVPASMESEPDSNTLMDVLCSVWRRRGVVFVALVLGALIGLAAAAASISRAPAPITYYIALSGMEITKQDGAGGMNEKLRVTVSYPNGMTFLPRDLLDPQVLQRVKQQLGLDSSVRLRDGIGVSFDSPWSEGIIKKYKDRLAVRGITQADIDALNRDLERDLLVANMSNLRIDVSPAALGVSSSVADAVAKALPQAWRDIYSEQYRTLLGAELPNPGPAGAEEDLSSASATVAAQMRIVAMMRGLSLMSADNRLTGVQNSAGKNANDLESDLRQFRTIVFAPFAAATFASDDPSVAAYRKDLELRLAAARREAETIDLTLRDMLNNPMGKSGGQIPEGMVQMDGTMLSQVLGLAQRASLTSMMPDMFQRREKIGSDIALLESELAMVSVQDASSVSPQSASVVSAELKRTADEYRDLYSAAFARLQTASSEFYADLSTPAQDSELFGMRTLALFVVPIALALLVALVYLVLAGLFTRSLSRR